MVGAIITLSCLATSSLKYSAWIKSADKGKWGPCSLEPAPKGITTTDEGVKTFVASTQVMSCRKIDLPTRSVCAGAEAQVMTSKKEKYNFIKKVYLKTNVNWVMINALQESLWKQFGASID